MLDRGDRTGNHGGGLCLPVGSALRTVRGGAHAKGCPRARVLDDLTVENNHFDGRVRVYPRLSPVHCALSRSMLSRACLRNPGSDAAAFRFEHSLEQRTLLANVFPRLDRRTLARKVESNLLELKKSIRRSAELNGVLWTIENDANLVQVCTSRILFVPKLQCSLSFKYILSIINRFYHTDVFKKKATNCRIRSLVMVRNQLPAQVNKEFKPCSGRLNRSCVR